MEFSLGCWLILNRPDLFFDPFFVTYMKVALVDMVFNGGADLIGKNLKTAIKNAIDDPLNAHVDTLNG